MIYTDDEMTKEYDNFVIKRFDCDYDDVKDSDAYDDDFDHDVEVEVKFTGPPRDLVLYVHPNCVSEKVFVSLRTDFHFEGWPVGRSEINIMGGAVKLLMDPKYIGVKLENLISKTDGIVQITTQNDANVTILKVPQKTKLCVFDRSSVRVEDSNIDRAVVTDSGDLVTKVPLNILTNNNAKIIDLKHDGISEVDANDNAKIITRNKKIKASIDDDATLTIDVAGKPPKTWSKKAMNMLEFACYVAKKEGRKSQAHIGDIRQILNLVDMATGGKLSKRVAEGIYVHD